MLSYCVVPVKGVSKDLYLPGVDIFIRLCSDELVLG